jgi:hypothetical protein
MRRFQNRPLFSILEVQEGVKRATKRSSSIAKENSCGSGSSSGSSHHYCFCPLADTNHFGSPAVISTDFPADRNQMTSEVSS